MRLHLFVTAVMLLQLRPAYAQTNRPAPRPNILIILADDMGYSDIGCYGGEITTPNIDRLAANGLRFTQFYNNARCSPTRASLMTGLYPHQAGAGVLDGDLGLPGYRGHLVDHTVTIAEVLRGAGYHTFMSGKWHLGTRAPWRPLDRGFEQFYGILVGVDHYFHPGGLFDEQTKVSSFPPDFYLTDAIGQRAVRYIDEHAAQKREQPFFGYVAFTSPHWPLHAPAADIERYRGKYMCGWDVIREQRLARMKQLGIVTADTRLSARSPAYPGFGQGPTDTDEQTPAWNSLDEARQRDMDLRMAVYAAQIDRMDQNIGRIVAALEKDKLLDSTLILFLSDNGGCGEEGTFGFDGGPFWLQQRKRSAGQPIIKGAIGAADSYSSYGMCWANASNTPFRMYKHFVHEGGIATPLIAHWPAGMKSRGEIRTDVVGHVVDLLATCADVAGATYPPQRDGHDVLPTEGESFRAALEGKPLSRQRPLFWEHEGNRAVRDGKWKLVSRYGHPWELYDLSTDRAELNDVALKEPSRVQTMSQQYDAWAQRCGVLPFEQVAPRIEKPKPSGTTKRS
jgi:arylsulfatase A-like enzyme